MVLTGDYRKRLADLDYAGILINPESLCSRLNILTRVLRRKYKHPTGYKGSRGKGVLKMKRYKMTLLDAQGNPLSTGFNQTVSASSADEAIQKHESHLSECGVFQFDNAPEGAVKNTGIDGYSRIDTDEVPLHTCGTCKYQVEGMKKFCSTNHPPLKGNFKTGDLYCDKWKLFDLQDAMRAADIQHHGSPCTP